MQSLGYSGPMMIAEEFFAHMRNDKRLRSLSAGAVSPYLSPMIGHNLPENVEQIYDANILQAIYFDLYDILHDYFRTGGIVYCEFLENAENAYRLEKFVDFLRNSGSPDENDRWLIIQRDKALDIVDSLKKEIFHDTADIVQSEREISFQRKRGKLGEIGQADQENQDIATNSIREMCTEIENSEDKWPCLLRLQNYMRLNDREISRIERKVHIKRKYPEDIDVVVDDMLGKYAFQDDYLLEYVFEGTTLERLKKSLEEARREILEDDLKYGDICSDDSEKRALERVFNKNELLDIKEKIGARLSAERIMLPEYEKEKHTFFKVIEKYLEPKWKKQFYDNFDIANSTHRRRERAGIF